MCRQEKAPVRDGIFLQERAENVIHSLEYFDDTHHGVRERVREFVEENSPRTFIARPQRPAFLEWGTLNVTGARAATSLPRLLVSRS